MDETPVDRVQAIAAREQKATEGPWRVQYEQCDCGGGFPCGHEAYPWALVGPENVGARTAGDDYKRHYGRKCSSVDEMTAEDAEFMAHAREDVPFLLAELERLTTERQATDAALTQALSVEQSLREQVARQAQEIAAMTKRVAEEQKSACDWMDMCDREQARAEAAEAALADLRSRVAAAIQRVDATFDPGGSMDYSEFDWALAHSGAIQDLERLVTP